MKDNDKHINQQPDGNYPEPSVPAGDAWANMNDLLNQEMPLSKAAISGKYQLVKVLKFIIPAITVLTASIIFWNYNSNKKTISANQVILSNSVSSSKTNIKSGQKEMKEENAKRNDSSLQKVKIDSGSLNSISVTSENGTTNMSGVINSGAVKPFSDIEKDQNILNKTRNRILNDNKKSAFDSSKDVSVLEKPVKIKVGKHSFDKNNVAQKSLSSQTKSNKNIIERNLAAQQDRSAGKFSGTFSRNEKTSSTDLNDIALKKALEKKITASLLILKSGLYSNPLKQDFDSLNIKKPQTITLPDNKKNKILNVLSKNIQAGLQWNVNLPMKGYDQFFTGANNKSNQFYIIFIPGIWIEKKLNNGNGIMLKLNPYTQYFGNNKEITSSTTSSSDSIGITKITSSTNLVKINGISGGLQYNQRIYDKLSIGIGANVYWQNRALLNNIVSDSAKTTMHDSLYSVKETSNDGRYLNFNFVTANLEVFYTWRGFQFGGGIAIPVTSMTGISDRKIRPVSGQLVFRWRLK